MLTVLQSRLGQFHIRFRKVVSKVVEDEEEIENPKYVLKYICISQFSDIYDIIY